MKLYMTAGFGETVGQDNLALIRRLGFVGIKQDTPLAANHEAVFGEIEANPDLEWILLVKPEHNVLQVGDELRARNLVSRVAIEYIGEPDTFDQTTPVEHANIMWVLRDTFPDITWILGGVSGLHERGFNFLTETMEAGIPPETIVSFHPYRTTRKPDDPFYYRTREEEFARLRELADGRRLWATEGGWHTAPHIYTTCFFVQRTRSWTEEQVAEFTTRELELQRAAGIEVFTWFQINDGHLPDYHEHHYGVKRLDGTLKPVADVFRLGGLSEQP